MKTIKGRMIYFLFISLLGVVFCIFSILKNMYDTSIFTIGITFILLGAIRLFQFYKISKDVNKLEEYNIKQNEERLVFLATRSANLALRIIICLEFVAVIVFMIKGNEQMSTLLGCIGWISLLIYFVMYYVYSKKY